MARAVVEQALLAAGSAPSAAHRQPWHFVVNSDPAFKREVRAAAERTEVDFHQDAPPDWLAALASLGTDHHKPYIETAPYQIAVFADRYCWHRMEVEGTTTTCRSQSGSPPAS